MSKAKQQTAPAKKTTPQTNNLADRRVQLTPQAADDVVAKAAAAKHQSSDEAAATAKEEGERTISVYVPRTFRLTTDDHVETEYLAGNRQMPAAHFDHPYVQANGVKRMGDE